MVTWLRDWIIRHPAMRAWLDGAAQTYTAIPTGSRRQLYAQTDIEGHYRDWEAVGNDLYKAMDTVKRGLTNGQQ
ncbi:hypothetical protein WCLP8_4240009 [uncultured Gammaproteobacteria bacterium]